MKKAYLLNDDGAWSGDFKLVADDYVVASNETTVEPPAGLYEPNFSNGAWSGIDQADFDAKQNNPPVTPSLEMQAINALGLQVAQLLTNKGGDTNA